MSKKTILSHELALQDAIKFLSFAKGKVSERPTVQGDPIPPGLDIFVPFTEANQVRLIGAGTLLEGDVSTILTLSIAGPNKSRTSVLDGKQSQASSANNIWWNFPLVVKDTVEAANETLELARSQATPLPLVSLAELRDATDDALVHRAIQGILDKSKDTEGPVYYNTASKLVPDAAQAFMLFAPSSAPDSAKGLWSNAPGRNNRNAASNTTGASDSSAPGMDVIG